MQEWQELQAEIVDRWTEVHKKSMIMLLIMLALTKRPMWSKELETWLMDVSGWEVSERGLHRTLKRMDQLGIVEHEDVSVPRTGMKRKSYQLTGFGKSVLKDMKKTSLKYVFNGSFAKILKNI